MGELTSSQPDRGTVEFCLRSGLIRNPQNTRFERLLGGVASDIWLVREDDTAFCVKQALPRLRVAADWRAPTERNIYEARWLNDAGSIAPGAVPRVLAEDAAQGMFAMSYLPAGEYPRWKDELLRGKVNVEMAAAVGQTMAKIHAGFAQDESASQRFLTDAIFEDIRIAPYLRATAHAHPNHRAELNRLANRTAGTRLTVVHGDVSPKNILVGPAGPVFLDAECAWYGDPAFDLAFCLNHLLLKCLVVRDAVDRLFDSFAALAGSYRAGIDWEAADALEARAASLLPGLFLARVDGKSPVEYLSQESQRNAVRSAASILLSDPPNRLERIVEVCADELSRRR